MARNVLLAAALVAALSAASPTWAAGTDAVHASTESHAEMTIFQAVVLGVVEGVTEYLPVSSTGHLCLAERLLGFSAEDKAAADAYAICIQAGAILAVVWLYFARLRTMVFGLIGRDPVGRRLAVNLVVAFLPAALMGLTFEKTIKHHLFGLWPITLAWFAGGVLILAFSTRGRRSLREGFSLESLSWQRAGLIGLMQCLAMWPGTSRSLVTILGGLLAGMGLSAAVEFSFLLGLITLGAATSYEMLQHGGAILTAFGWGGPLLGLIVAFVSAILAVRWMVTYLSRHGLALFGYYRIALAVIVYLFILRKAP